MDTPKQKTIYNIFYDHNSIYPIIILTETGEIFRYSISDKKWIEYYYDDSTDLISTLFDKSKGLIVHTLLNNKKDSMLFVFRKWTSCIFEGGRKFFMRLDKLCIAELKLNEHNHNNRKIKVIHEYNDLYKLNGSCPIIIKDRFHLIGGYQSKKHALLNTDTQKFDTLHNVYNEKVTINNSRLVKSGNFLFSFGGSTRNPFKTLDYIHKYDIIKNKWKRLKITMPKPMTRFGCVTIMNDKYILFFGGGHQSKSYDDIYIYSVENNLFTLSNIKYPQRGKCHVISVNNKQKEELTVYGFVRYQWKKIFSNQQSIPPRYLIHIMRKYFHIEYIHLFHQNGHWRIDIFDILLQTS